jgi:hypothetical protein
MFSLAGLFFGIIIINMDKRRLHHIWTKTRRIKPWYVLVVALTSSTICVAALRQNNLHMATLRDAVYAADKNGGNVQQALQNLQVYVTAHMNTDLSAGPNAPYPPIQLQYTYDRAVQADGAAANAENAKIYTDAQSYCEQKIPNGFSGRYRIDCVQSYVDSHGVKLPNIPDSLYKFDFLSPAWSPDLAGWSLLAAVTSFLAFAVLWMASRWLYVNSR